MRVGARVDVAQSAKGGGVGLRINWFWPFADVHPSPHTTQLRCPLMCPPIPLVSARCASNYSHPNTPWAPSAVFHTSRGSPTCEHCALAPDGEAVVYIEEEGRRAAQFPHPHRRRQGLHQLLYTCCGRDCCCLCCRCCLGLGLGLPTAVACAGHRGRVVAELEGGGGLLRRAKQRT